MSAYPIGVSGYPSASAMGSGACALAVGAFLRLPPVPVLAGAALSGLPMLVGVAVGVHWLGSPLALAVFGAWCARLARRPAVA